MCVCAVIVKILCEGWNGKLLWLKFSSCNIIQIVTDVDVTVENYLPVVGNIPEAEGRGEYFQLRGNNFQ